MDWLLAGPPVALLIFGSLSRFAASSLDVLPTIAKKSVGFVIDNAAKENPFFLYVPLNSPHTPISPSKTFAGKSGLGKYADFVMETDWAIGQIVDAVDKAGVATNTLVDVTADNGCSPAAASRAEALRQGHEQQPRLSANPERYAIYNFSIGFEGMGNWETEAEISGLNLTGIR